MSDNQLYQIYTRRNEIIARECYGCETNRCSQRDHPCLSHPKEWIIATNYRALEELALEVPFTDAVVVACKQRLYEAYRPALVEYDSDDDAGSTDTQ